MCIHQWWKTGRHRLQEPFGERRTARLGSSIALIEVRLHRYGVSLLYREGGTARPEYDEMSAIPPNRARVLTFKSLPKNEM